MSPINLKDLSSQDARNIAMQAIPARYNERQQVCSIIDGIIDLTFSIGRWFYPSHLDFIILHYGKYRDVEGEYVHVYVTEFRPLFENLQNFPCNTILVYKVVEVTNAKREIFGGYCFKRRKDEILYRFVVEHFIVTPNGRIYRKAGSLKECNEVYKGLSRLNKYIFKNFDTVSLLEHNMGFRRDSYI